jgi:beta-lactamase regulating signal transducer with metallopeptidase domain
MQELFAVHLKTSWQGAVLILLILVVQKALGAKLGPRWRYGLWALVMIRLALPWSVPSQASVFNVLKFPRVSNQLRAGVGPGHSKTEATSALDVAQTEHAPAGILQPRWGSQHRSIPAWFVGIWAAGASLLAGCVLVTHVRLWQRLRRERPLVDAAVLNLLEDCKQKLRVRARVMLVESRHVGSPSLFGFLHPRLLLPSGLAQSFSLDELRLIFLHELAHIKRNDLLVGWIATGLQIIHWFNPLVWLAFQRMRADREVACDALALSCAPEHENQRYGDTIIKLLENFGRSAWAPGLAGAVENKNQLKERIRMIARFKKHNGGVALAAAIFIALGMITLTDAQSTAAKSGNDLIGTWILAGRPGEAGDAPAAGGRTKTITDTEWSITQVDLETGATLFHHGGTYTQNGNAYIERVEFADASTKNLVGRTNRFRIRLEGDVLTLTGIGNPWREVWKRVYSTPQKTEVPALQGAWSGKEKGSRTDAKASLILNGSTLEFHGEDTNEWYKAAFTVYDTSPQQMVIVIKECPFPDYVHKTTYAIFQLQQDGTLTITGNEPGAPAAPAGFEAAGSRKLVFKRD